MFDQTTTSLPSQRLGHAVSAAVSACVSTRVAHTHTVEWRRSACIAFRASNKAHMREITLIWCRTRLIIIQIFVVRYEELGTSILGPCRAQMSEILTAFTLESENRNFTIIYCFTSSI